MNTEIENEVNRLKALPQKGYFTCLHHASDMIEYSNNLMERINYILNCKPKKEILLRLKNIHYVSPERFAEYEKIRDAAYEEYLKIRETAKAEYKKIHDAAYAKYEKIRDAAYEEYEKILETANAEYEKIRDAAYAEYTKIRDAAYAEYKKIRDPDQGEFENKMVTWLKTWVPFTTWNGHSIFN